MGWWNEMIISEVNIKPIFNNEGMAQITHQTNDINETPNTLQIEDKNPLEA